MTRHELKVHPQFWDGIKHGSKPFEVRRNDRHFRVGDICVLREYNPEHGYVSQDTVNYPITYVLHHEDFPIGIQRGFVVLGFGVMPGLDDGK